MIINYKKETNSILEREGGREGGGEREVGRKGEGRVRVGGREKGREGEREGGKGGVCTNKGDR